MKFISWNVNGFRACLEKGFAWNEAEMDKAIEDEVAFTKSVNAKTN